VSDRQTIDQAEWPEFFVAFSNANQSRLIAITVDDPGLGRSCLNDGVPLLALDYDPVDKGDDLVVSIGRESVEATHVIRSPTDVAELRDEQGTVTGLEIMDQGGATTRLLFAEHAG
jgi:hypothetical protein